MTLRHPVASAYVSLKSHVTFGMSRGTCQTHTRFVTFLQPIGGTCPLCPDDSRIHVWHDSHRQSHYSQGASLVWRDSSPMLHDSFYDSFVTHSTRDMTHSMIFRMWRDSLTGKVADDKMRDGTWHIPWLILWLVCVTCDLFVWRMTHS